MIGAEGALPPAAALCPPGAASKIRIKIQEALIVDMLNNFIGFIMNMIKYVQDLVAYFRAKNEGKDAVMPEFPSVSIGGGDAEPAE